MAEGGGMDCRYWPATPTPMSIRLSCILGEGENDPEPGPGSVSARRSGAHIPLSLSSNTKPSAAAMGAAGQSAVPDAR